MSGKIFYSLLWMILGGLVVLVIIALFFQKDSKPDWNMVAALAAIIGVVCSAITYLASANRARKIETLKEFSIIREKYPNINPEAKNPVSEEKRDEYLKSMERFCTGINMGVYDIDVLRETAKSFLLTQYDNYVKDIILRKREQSKNATPENLYCQYEKVINHLRREGRSLCRTAKNNAEH